MAPVERAEVLIAGSVAPTFGLNTHTHAELSLDMRLRRRTWPLRLRVVAGAALVLGLWAFWLEPASLRVSEERVSLRWPARPLRIAILTDLHVGSPFNDLGKLRRVVDETNAARPDVICILGDLVIQGVLGGRFVAPEEIATELKRLHAPAGTVAVLGNHDGWFDHDRVKAAVEQSGIRVLEDTAARLDTPTGASGLRGSAICGQGGTIWTRHCQPWPAQGSRCYC